MLSGYIISPKNVGVEDGTFTRTSHVLTKPFRI